MFIDMTALEVNNLLAFITGKGRIQLTGDEAFEFVKLVNKLAEAEPLDKPVEVVTEDVPVSVNEE